MWEPKYGIGNDVEYLLPSGEWSEGWTITRIDLQDRTYQAIHFPSGDRVEDVQESDIREDRFAEPTCCDDCSFGG